MTKFEEEERRLACAAWTRISLYPIHELAGLCHTICFFLKDLNNCLCPVNLRASRDLELAQGISRELRKFERNELVGPSLNRLSGSYSRSFVVEN